MSSSSARADLIGALVGAIAIAVASSALGIVVNRFSPNGVPLLVEQSEVEGPPLELPAGVTGLNLEELQAAHESGTALFLDARAPEEYEEGHIPGALNLPVHDFEEHFLDLMDVIEEAPSLVLYCGGYECSDAIDLAERLLEVGHPDIRVFEQGLRVWVDAGGDTREGSGP